MTFRKLYHKSRTGAIVQWEIWTKGKTIFTRWGQVDGEMQISEKDAAPTNVGRSNERDAVAQAEFEAQAMWTFKVERKYSETLELAHNVVRLPMLAHEFDKRGKKLKYPADVQPKFDGNRCLAFMDGTTVELISRSGKPYYVPHITEALREAFKNTGDWVLDGELYIHGHTLQSLNRLIKKQRPESVHLEYWVYDVPIAQGAEDLPWLERRQILRGFQIDVAFNRSGKLIHVPSVPCSNEKEVREMERLFVSQGYEGAIVRSHEGLYDWGHRSPDLLKVKSFKDAEYEVVGAEEGVGKFAGAAIWVCKTPEGKEFKATPKGSQEERRAFWDNRNEYVGRQVTVRHYALTEDGIPQFPVATGFRLEEDLPI
jgi:DNA ligase-1